MTTLRQLANQASEALSHQTVSVQDLIDVAALLSLPLEGQDGNDSADAIAPTIEELIQIATVHGTGLKEAAAKYQAEPPAPRAAAKSKTAKGGKKASVKTKAATNQAAAPGQMAIAARTQTHQQQVQQAMIQGVKEAMELDLARQQGVRLYEEIKAGVRQPDPNSPVEMLIAAKAYEINGAAESNPLRVEGDELYLDISAEEINVDTAFEVAAASIRLADYATQPALPSAY